MDEFDEICRRCTPVVYRFLLSLCKDASLADELTAETFYQAYLHIVVSHEDIHDAETLLRRAALLCDTGNDELRPALAELRSAMSMVAETQQISAKNIL